MPLTKPSNTRTPKAVTSANLPSWIPLIAFVISIAGILGFGIGRLHLWARWDVYGVSPLLFPYNVQDTVLVGYMLHHRNITGFFLICFFILIFTIFAAAYRRYTKPFIARSTAMPSTTMQNAWVTSLYIAIVTLSIGILFLIGGNIYRSVVRDTKLEIEALKSKNLHYFDNMLPAFIEIVPSGNAATLRGLMIEMNDKFLAVHDGQQLHILRVEKDVERYKSITLHEAFATQKHLQPNNP